MANRWQSRRPCPGRSPLWTISDLSEPLFFGSERIEERFTVLRENHQSRYKFIQATGDGEDRLLELYELFLKWGKKRFKKKMVPEADRTQFWLHETPSF